MPAASSLLCIAPLCLTLHLICAFPGKSTILFYCRWATVYPFQPLLAIHYTLQLLFVWTCVFSFKLWAMVNSHDGALICQHGNAAVITYCILTHWTKKSNNKKKHLWLYYRAPNSHHLQVKWFCTSHRVSPLQSYMLYLDLLDASFSSGLSARIPLNTPPPPQAQAAAVNSLGRVGRLPWREGAAKKSVHWEIRNGHNDHHHIKLSRLSTWLTFLAPWNNKKKKNRLQLNDFVQVLSCLLTSSMH